MLEIGTRDVRRAFLYAGGGLDATDSAEFESRLGEEQGLREALCQAVEMTRQLEGLPAVSPSSAYRARVRQRLRLRGGLWRWLTRRRSYRGHPALWSILGAAAALVVLALPSYRMLPDGQRPTPVAEPTRLTHCDEPFEDFDTTATSEMAETFASLPGSDHLVRALEDEIRKRDRRLPHGDHVLHPLATHGVRH